jgi:hypothetical protein
MPAATDPISSFVRVSGHFHVPTLDLGGGISATQRIISRITLELAQQNVGIVTQTSGNIAYNRGYSLWPYSSNRLALFDPGRIYVEQQNNQILIKYYLGLRPLYIAAATLLFVQIFFFLSGLPNRFSYIRVSFFVEIILFISIAYRLWRLHLWLKSVVLSIVMNETSDSPREN